MSTFKSRAVVFSKERAESCLQVRDDSLHQMENFGTSRSYSQMKGEQSGRLTDRLGLCCFEVRVKHKSEAVDLSVNLPPHHQLWSWALDSDRKNEMADISDKITLLWRVGSLCLCDRMKSSVIGEAFGLETLLLHIERRQLMWFWHVIWMPSGHHLHEVF